MQLIEAEIGENLTKTAMLRNMDVSNSTALKVDDKDVKSVRATISGLHGETSLRFTTSKIEGGILVWRIK